MTSGLERQCDGKRSRGNAGRVRCIAPGRKFIGLGGTTFTQLEIERGVGKKLNGAKGTKQKSCKTSK
jgi:hypothetical protein